MECLVSSFCIHVLIVYMLSYCNMARDVPATRFGCAIPGRNYFRPKLLWPDPDPKLRWLGRNRNRVRNLQVLSGRWSDRTFGQSGTGLPDSGIGHHSGLGYVVRFRSFGYYFGHYLSRSLNNQKYIFTPCTACYF